MFNYRVKPVVIMGAALLMHPALVFAQTETDINLNVKHSVGRVAEFDREKFITLHATLNENGWDGEEDKLKYMMEDLNVYFGRDNGSMLWNLNQANEDPNRPGYIDPNYINQKGQENREIQYGTNRADRHQYDDHNDVMIGGQTSTFWQGRSTRPCCNKEGWEIAGAGAIGEYMGRYVNEFYRNEGEAPSQG
ncbi:hypothetical protein [Catenovulum sediminis]|uniref:hypothetical protein n=1 Tax=Catenovulum sediminis TaxID=1740262 RepID=UPI001FE5DA76|nr:hypothetical protein [Catenovulum sediminis]